MAPPAGRARNIVVGHRNKRGARYPRDIRVEPAPPVPAPREASGLNALIRGDVDGDGVADLEIMLGLTLDPLAATDFIL